MKRKPFIKSSALASASPGINRVPGIFLASTFANSFPSRRPPLAERKFVSEAVEKTVVETKKKLRDEEPAWLFENCFPNTLDTTVLLAEKPHLVT